MRFLNAIVTIPIWIALVFLLVGTGAISFDKTTVAFGRFIGIIFTAIDKTTQANPDNPFPPDQPRRSPSGEGE